MNQAIAKLDLKEAEANLAMYKAKPNLRKGQGSSYRENYSGRRAGLEAGKNIYPGTGKSSRIGSGAKGVGPGSNRLKG